MESIPNSSLGHDLNSLLDFLQGYPHCLVKTIGFTNGFLTMLISTMLT